MGVVERIKQIQEDMVRKAATEKAAAEAEWKRTEPERIAVAESKRQSDLLEKQQQEEIIRESGIKEKLRLIEQEFLQKTTHRLYIRREIKGAYQNGHIYDKNQIIYELAWGYRKDQEKPNEIRGYNYNSFYVYLNIDDGKIDVGARGQTSIILNKHEWTNDKSVIDEALAKFYFSPCENKEPAETWSLN